MAEPKFSRATVSFLQRGGGWVCVQCVLMVAVFVMGAVCPGRSDSIAGVYLGGALMVLGGLVALPGLFALKDKLTPFPKPREHSELVQHGIYAAIRHPLYASLMVTAVGWVLFRQSWSAVVPTVALLVFFDAKARREELWLRSKFPAYQSYQRRVRRFIPGIY